jgi:hypothetical protein
MLATKAASVVGLVTVISAKRIPSIEGQSATLAVDHSEILEDCMGLPNFPGKCLVSKSPGACYSAEDDSEQTWQCWTNEQAPETMNNDTCKNAVKKAGACRFYKHDVVVQDADIMKCSNVEGFVSQCSQVVGVWGACYQKDSDQWQCIEKTNTMLDGFKQGDCEVLPVDVNSSVVYDGVCSFEQAEQTLYKCSTVPSYNKDEPAASCSYSEVPFACFSLRSGVTWQCFESLANGTNPKCASTQVPVDEQLAKGDRYDGACVLPGHPAFDGAKNASELLVESPTNSGRPIITTTPATPTSTTTTSGASRHASTLIAALLIAMSACF